MADKLTDFAQDHSFGLLVHFPLKTFDLRCELFIVRIFFLASKYVSHRPKEPDVLLVLLRFFVLDRTLVHQSQQVAEPAPHPLFGMQLCLC